MTGEIARYGAYAVFALMLVDALVPAGAELTMLAAGLLAVGGRVTLLGVPVGAGLEAYIALALVGVAGSMAGALLGWWIGARGGRRLLERHGAWFRADQRSLERADRWFARWGDAAVLLGRLTPLVRSFVSIPAGALGSPLVRYTALSLAGSLIWCFGLAGAGWALASRWRSFDQDSRYADVIVVAATLLILVGVQARRRRRVA
jgi:membrane protein DedA with SNARE-associated domain